MTTTTAARRSWKPWFLAARPKTLSAACAPVCVATALAYVTATVADWMFPVYAMIAALFLQVGTNFVNDALDFKKGADTVNRLGPQRATQMGWLTPKQVLAGGFASFFLAALFSMPLIVAGGLPLLALLLVSIACGYLYTGGPRPLAYVGLGDLFVLLFFGWGATLGMFYVLTGTVTAAAFLAGTQVGLLCTTMIAINNLRDSKEDATTGKRTLAVRFGETFSKIEITLLLFIPYALNLLWLSYGYNPATMLPLIALPLARRLVIAIWKTEPSAVYNQFLAVASLHYLLFAILLMAGLLMA